MTAIFAAFAIGCDDDDVRTAGPNETIVGFTTGFNPNYRVDLETAVMNVPVNLISYQNETFPDDVTVQISVNPESTAEAGVHYETFANSVTVPSGSTVAFLPVTVKPIEFDPNDPTTLVLDMTTVTTENAVIGMQYQKLVISLQGICVSSLGGNYATSAFRPDNGFDFRYNETIAPTENEGEYVTQYIGQYHGTSFSQGIAYSGGVPNGFGTSALAVPSAGYIFSDICGKLKVNTQGLGLGAYSNEIRQNADQYAASSVNEESGVITIYYSIFFDANTIERPFQSTYTPL